MYLWMDPSERIITKQEQPKSSSSKEDRVTLIISLQVDSSQLHRDFDSKVNVLIRDHLMMVRSHKKL